MFACFSGCFLLLKFIKTVRFGQNIYKSLNFFAVVLFLIQIPGFCKVCKKILMKKTVVTVDQKSDFPNIYHICLDSYVSHKYLSKAYGFDNSGFYNALRNLGFWYDMEAKSNYSSTIPSFCSAFEMDYFNVDVYNENDLQNRIYFNNKALNILKSNGYRCYINSPDIPTLESANFDNRLQKSRLLFYYYLFQRTPIEGFLFKHFLKEHYNNVRTQFDQMISAKTEWGDNGNYFLFHVLCPHEPFLFNETGGMNTELKSNLISMFKADNDVKKRISWYVNQIKYINALTLRTIKQILNSYEEKNRPIIILHGDHGLSVSATHNIDKWKVGDITDQDKAILSILQTVYLPKYLNIVPPPPGLVNLYRWLINSLFGQNLEYLPSKQIMRIDNRFIPDIDI